MVVINPPRRQRRRKYDVSPQQSLLRLSLTQLAWGGALTLFCIIFCLHVNEFIYADKGVTTPTHPQCTTRPPTITRALGRYLGDDGMWQQ